MVRPAIDESREEGCSLRLELGREELWKKRLADADRRGDVSHLWLFWFFQPHTLRIQYAISTFCCIILTIQGWSSIPAGAGRRVGSRVRLGVEELSALRNDVCWASLSPLTLS